MAKIIVDSKSTMAEKTEIPPDRRGWDDSIDNCDPSPMIGASVSHAHPEDNR